MLQSVESPPFTEANLLRLQHHKRPWDHYTHNLNYYLPENEMGMDPESCLTESPFRSETKDPQQTDGGVCNKREKRKRIRTRTTTTAKDKEEVESQRMTHIAVERNRRRQMNHHLTALRSLIPPSYIQRGDQASIIGGAIDLVKELEQLLQSLQTQKRRRKADEAWNGMLASSAAGVKLDENNWAAGNVQVRVIQNHVNLKIECERTPGHLVRAIVGLEQLRLTVLHLTITSFETSSVHYSFSLKIEDDCKVGSADEIAGAVHQLFSFINGS